MFKVNQNSFYHSAASSSRAHSRFQHEEAGGKDLKTIFGYTEFEASQDCMRPCLEQTLLVFVSVCELEGGCLLSNVES